MLQQLMFIEILMLATSLMLVFAAQQLVRNVRSRILSGERIPTVFEPLVGGRMLVVIGAWFLFVADHPWLMCVLLALSIGIPFFRRHADNYAVYNIPDEE